MGIIITGDIHGNFKHLNALISRYRKHLDMVICCGDFGYWPNFDQDHTKIVSSVPILWCDGNHENHWELKRLIENDNPEIAPNVFYMPRGSMHKLKDGRTILFMGGGDSIDKHSRVLGRDWFPEEIITQKDMANLPDNKIDIFVTHTCPTEIVPIMVRYYEGRDYEPSNYALSELWKIYRPDLWFFGHWHHYKEGYLEDTKWYALDCIGTGGRWWIWMP